MKNSKNLFKRVFTLVLASILFVAPVTASAAIDPDWVYVDPDGGFKSFGFESSPYYIQKGSYGTLENNENNTYWRVENGGHIMFAINVVNPVYCRFVLVRTSNGKIIQVDEDYVNTGLTLNYGIFPLVITPCSYILYTMMHL